MSEAQWRKAAPLPVWAAQVLELARALDAGRSRYLRSYHDLVDGKIFAYQFDEQERAWLTLQADALAGFRWIAERAAREGEEARDA